MNKELKDRIFDLPNNVLELINDTYVNLKGKNITGIKRAETLLLDKKVNYGQLKKIIHDLENTDKFNNKTTYDLYGGEPMLYWGRQFLKGERDLIKNRKKSKKNADSISGITGMRKNSFLQKHGKKFSFKTPLNLVKSNSEKTSVSQLNDFKLFEQINKIKKLINY